MRPIPWFVQSNLQPEPQDELLAEIKASCSPLIMFEGVPFAPEAPPMPDGRFFPMGTVNMMERIREKRPEVVFGGEHFNYRAYLENYGDMMLNAGAWIGRLADFSPSAGDFPLFLRPTRDDKSFAGEVWENPERFKTWRAAILEGTTIIDPSVEVLAGPPLNILEEWRVVIANAAPATQSRYRRLGRRDLSADGFPATLLELVAGALGRWQPAPLFALDVALTDAGPRIVELGSIHSCGLYGCDRRRFVDAVNGVLRST